jgi:hypothetical protein
MYWKDEAAMRRKQSIRILPCYIYYHIYITYKA